MVSTATDPLGHAATEPIRDYLRRNSAAQGLPEVLVEW